MAAHLPGAVREWHAMLNAAGWSPQTTVGRRLRIDYARWPTRMQPPKILSDTIAALIATAPEPVGAHFAFEPGDHFQLDTASILATPAG